MPRNNTLLQSDLFTNKPFDPHLLENKWPLLGFWRGPNSRAIPGSLFMVIMAAPALAMPPEPHVIVPSGYAYAMKNDPLITAQPRPFLTPQQILDSLLPAPKGATAQVGDIAFAFSEDRIIHGTSLDLRRRLKHVEAAQAFIGEVHLQRHNEYMQRMKDKFRQQAAKQPAWSKTPASGAKPA